jgi:hypothetical protein
MRQRCKDRERVSDLRRRQHYIGTTDVDSARRHVKVIRRRLVLCDRDAAGVAHRRNPLGAVP